MDACFHADPDFTGVAIDHYSYPTRLIRLPFTPPLPGLRDLADGLRTFIDERHGDRDAIFIIAHSLGGLIARHMLVSELRSGRNIKVEKLVLLAVPSTGSTLANVGSLVSMAHRQLKALAKDESGLMTLNIDWEQLKVEQTVQVRYVLGGCDRTVPPESAAPYIGADNKSVIIDADHRSIVAPTGANDLRYKTVKRFLIQESANVPVEKTIPRGLARPADPLFDVYTQVNEPYYVVRSFDNVLMDVMAKGHVWLTGQSGIGKSAALRRAVYSNGWAIHHINLAGHQFSSPDGLFPAICAELAAIDYNNPALSPSATFIEQVNYAKRMIEESLSDRVSSKIIEEIPLTSESLEEAVVVIARFLDLLDADAQLHGQVRFAFSSRHNIGQSSSALPSKVREKLQILPVESWLDSDITRMVELLTPAIRSELPIDDQKAIVAAAGGSPRFVKMVFRHWRNGTAGDDKTEQLCARVASDLIS